MHSLHSLTFVGAHFERENLAASLLFFMVDQLATQIYLSAKSHDVTHVIFVGSFLASGSSHVRRMFREKLQNCSMYLQVSASFTHNIHCFVVSLCSRIFCCCSTKRGRCLCVTRRTWAHWALLRNTWTSAITATAADVGVPKHPPTNCASGACEWWRHDVDTNSTCVANSASLLLLHAAFSSQVFSERSNLLIASLSSSYIFFLLFFFVSIQPEFPLMYSNRNIFILKLFYAWAYLLFSSCF